MLADIERRDAVRQTTKFTEMRASIHAQTAGRQANNTNPNKPIVFFGFWLAPLELIR